MKRMHCQTTLKHQISCILLVSLSSPYIHDIRSQEPNIRTGIAKKKIEKILDFLLQLNLVHLTLV